MSESKKYNGFTLAEVLITLAIIGVIASLTLPTLLSNVAEQQAISGFKKAMNTLNNVGQLIDTTEGFDYSSVNTTLEVGSSDIYNDDGTLKQSLWAIMSKYANVKELAYNKIKDGSCSRNPYQIFFRDGTAICYGHSRFFSPDGYVVYVDTNGTKGPNRLFLCAEEDERCLKKDRKWGDQFIISLEGKSAMPGTYDTLEDGTFSYSMSADDIAARWALEQ